MKPFKLVSNIVHGTSLGVGVVLVVAIDGVFVACATGR